MDRLRALEVFTHVVEQGSFAAAGRRLDLPRGIVSKQVQLLEDHFGTRLLNRTTRRLSLTESGERMYRHCRIVLTAMEDAERDLDEQRGRPRGRLRIAAPAAFTEMYLGSMLEAFLRRYPEVTIDLECSEQFVDLVESGFDVGVRIGELPPSSLVARRLAPSNLVICASPRYLQRHGTPGSLSDLRSHVCLGYSYQATGQRWDFTTPSGPLTLQVSSRHRTNSNAMLRTLVMGGFGLAQLPSYFVAPDLATGRMVTVLDRYQDTSRSVYVIYPHRQHLPAKVRALVDFLAARFANGAPWKSNGGEAH